MAQTPNTVTGKTVSTQRYKTNLLLTKSKQVNDKLNKPLKIPFPHPSSFTSPLSSAGSWEWGLWSVHLWWLLLLLRERSPPPAAL